MMFRKHCKRIKFKHARRMRDNPTPSERVLWQCLRLGRTGFKFRQQGIILGWIVDFYCAKAKLVVEIDGGYHSTPKQLSKDARRDTAMKAYGFDIMRFSSEEVMADTQAVVRDITERCKHTRLRS